MMTPHSGLLADRIRRSATLARLSELARDRVGISILVLMPQDGTVLTVMPDGVQSAYPDYCQLIHATAQGRGRCLRCHALMAVGAYSRGLYLHRCHTGVAMLAAPVERDGPRPSDIVVVSSCAFSQRAGAAGWRHARAALKGVAVDWRRLQEAYRRLPVLDGARLTLAKGLLRVAAACVGEMETCQADLARVGTGSAGAPSVDSAAVERELKTALTLTRDRTLRDRQVSPGAQLVAIVKGVIGRHPELAFTVAEVARFVHVTPNHFSMLFARHAGTPFKAYLQEKRLALAQTLLRTLTLNVHEVAYRAGFQDANYFSRCFKAHTGKTPLEWRSAL